MYIDYKTNFVFYLQLEESKVFVASDTSKNVFGAGIGDNDAKMFTAPPPSAPNMDSQVFSASSLPMPNSSPGGPALIDSTNTLHTNTNSISQSSTGQNSLTQNSYGQNAINQNSLGLSTSSQLPPSTLGQR